MNLDMTVALPVRNGGKLFRQLAAHLEQVQRRYGLDVLIVDNGSTDGTRAVARDAGFQVHEIPPEEFGYGTTRNRIAEMVDAELLAFISHDALPVTPNWPELFAEALQDRQVAGVYGRQVPRDANTKEMFFVALNYPRQPHRYEPEEIQDHHPRPGRVLFSNAFGAVRRELLLEQPYPEELPMGEDQYFAWKMLERGYSIVYEPEAEALHAHRYSFQSLFGRAFQIGQGHRRAGLDEASASFGEGLRFLAEELRYFISHGHAHRVPEVLLYEFVRWSGFQTGRLWGNLSQ